MVSVRLPFLICLCRMPFRSFVFSVDVVGYTGLFLCTWRSTQLSGFDCSCEPIADAVMLKMHVGLLNLMFAATCSSCWKDCILFYFFSRIFLVLLVVFRRCFLLVQLPSWFFMVQVSRVHLTFLLVFQCEFVM